MVGFAIYIGSQIGYSPKFWLSTQRQSVGILGHDAQVFPGRVAIGGGTEHAGYAYVLPHESSSC